MITKTKIQKQETQLVTPVQYWLSEDLEIRCCNVKGLCKNSAATYSTPQILFIKHVSRQRTLDISVPFKKAQDLIEIIQDFMTTNEDFNEN